MAPWNGPNNLTPHNRNESSRLKSHVAVSHSFPQPPEEQLTSETALVCKNCRSLFDRMDDDDDDGGQCDWSYQRCHHHCA